MRHGWLLHQRGRAKSGIHAYWICSSARGPSSHHTNVGEDHIPSIQSRNQTPIVENTENGSIAFFWERCKTVGLPSQAWNILQASWREGTKNRYANPWKLWTSWCISRNQCPFSAPVSDIFLFLTEQFSERNLSYRTIEVYKSCISQMHDPIDGQPLGNLPLVNRFICMENSSSINSSVHFFHDCQCFRSRTKRKPKIKVA